MTNRASSYSFGGIQISKQNDWLTNFLIASYVGHSRQIQWIQDFDNIVDNFLCIDNGVDKFEWYFVDRQRLLYFKIKCVGIYIFATKIARPRSHD